MDSAEYPTHEIYDWITPSNPIELSIEREQLLELLKGHVAVVEQVLDHEADEVTKEELRFLLRRRLEMIRWAEAHDASVPVGIYPAFENPEVPRERGQEAEGQAERSHIVFWRLRQALEDDHAYWAQFEAAPKTAYGEDLWSGFQRWANAAFDATADLRYRPALESLPLHDGNSLAIRRGEWRSMVAADVSFPLLSLRVAEQAYAMSARAASRCMDLITLVVTERPTADVASFLERVAQLYLWGFDSEVYALGRSVLDAALKQRLPDDLVRRILREQSLPRYPDLRTRIRAAVRKRMLTKQEGEVADRIRSDGNDVIHEFPNANLYHASPLDLIRSLVGVLRSLLDPSRAL